MFDLNLWLLALLMVTGIVAGVINTIAGGGSSLTIPALMLLGLPADVANATNRVGVFLQCCVGSWGFRQADKLDTANIGPILVPTLLGGLAGALLAAFLPVSFLKPLLLGTMIAMALVILVRPSVVSPPAGTKNLNVSESSKGWWVLFIAGVYGGFVQAGVGFVLLAALSGALRYDLVRGNALKMICTLAFTGVALAVFIVEDLVLWVPGLVLAAGTMIGAALAVRIALKVSQRALKWFLFLMTLVTCGAALLF